MQASYIRQYTKVDTGNTVYVHTVSGTEIELKNFKKIQGKHYKEDNGTPLWFSTNYCGEVVDLIITSKNKVIADMSEFKKQASLVSLLGGNLGQAMADAVANKMLGKKPTSSTTEQPEIEADAEGLEGL